LGVGGKRIYLTFTTSNKRYNDTTTKDNMKNLAQYIKENGQRSERTLINTAGTHSRREVMYYVQGVDMANVHDAIKLKVGINNFDGYSIGVSLLAKGAHTCAYVLYEFPDGREGKQIEPIKKN
jgi:hypothetical protein